MNFFEQELHRLFGDGETIQDPKFVGRACLGDLGGDLRVRAEFITTGYTDHYDALRLMVLKRTEGEVDRLVLRFQDILGRKSVSNPNFREGVIPYIWANRDKTDWYVYRPTAVDHQALRQAAGDYLDVFRERVQERERPAPVLKPSGRSAPKKRKEER